MADFPNRLEASPASIAQKEKKRSGRWDSIWRRYSLYSMHIIETASNLFYKREREKKRKETGSCIGKTYTESWEELCLPPSDLLCNLYSLTCTRRRESNDKKPIKYLCIIYSYRLFGLPWPRRDMLISFKVVAVQFFFFFFKIKRSDGIMRVFLFIFIRRCALAPRASRRPALFNIFLFHFKKEKKRKRKIWEGNFCISHSPLRFCLFIYTHELRRFMHTEK